MPRSRQSPASAAEPAMRQDGGGPPNGPMHPQNMPHPDRGPMFPGPGDFPQGDGFNHKGPPGPFPPNSEFNHDFLDELIPPVSNSGYNNPPFYDNPMHLGPPGSHPGAHPGAHPGGHPGPPPGHPGHPGHPMSFSGPGMPGMRPPINSLAGMMGPGSQFNGLVGKPGPGPPMPHPSGPLGVGRTYPPDQPMVFNRSNPNAPPIYPCGICHKEVHDNDQAILCESGCNFWFHRVCTGLSELAFLMLTKEVYAEWVCDRCLTSKAIPLVKLKP